MCGANTANKENTFSVKPEQIGIRKKKVGFFCYLKGEEMEKKRK